MGTVLLDSSAVVGFLQPDDTLRGRHTEPAGSGRRRSTVAPPDALILATAGVRRDVERVVGGDARWTRVCRALDVSFVRLRG